MAKVLPSAPEAEATLLGNMMVYPKAARIAMEEGLTEEDFFSEANRRIFLAIDSLYKQGELIDPTTVVTRLKDMELLDKCGGVAYLSDLADAAVTSANTKSYVSMIHDKAVIRKMIEAAETVAEEGYTGQTDINEYLDNCEKAVLDISRSRRTSEFRTSPELMNSVLVNIQNMSDNKTDITGLKTGFSDLDHTLHGLQKGDMIVLAARPSMGKTAVALNLALNVAAYQPRGAVAIFSLEMAAEQLAMRLLSAKSHIPGDKLRTGRLSDADWNRLNEAAAELKTANIYIDDSSMTKMSEIFSKCRRLKADVGLNLIVIDYIQLISASGSRRNENRQQEISEISRNLKALARELDVPVIALSQLSRSVEQRDNKHPMLSDLRESGAIEQDADIVLMLYREAYYDDNLREKAREEGTERLEINIAKHRNGATRKVYVAFENTTNALFNIAANE